jgi:hypothetical protein
MMVNNDFLNDNELFAKNLILSTEFNKYVIEKPEILDKIPNNAAVVLLPSDDPEFCSKVLALVEHHKKIDDLKNRPIVYIRINKLAPPPPSRILDLQFEPELNFS